MENLYTPCCIRSYTGRYVNIFEPMPEMFCIEDIAHALSQIPRFGGHLKHHYSVAMHSIQCMKMGVALGLTLKENYTLLMHDSAEAYLYDLAGPYKREMPEYNIAERKLNYFLANTFGFHYPFPHSIHHIDKVQLEREWRELMINEGQDYTTMEESEQQFLHFFYEHKKILDMPLQKDPHDRSW